MPLETATYTSQLVSANPAHTDGLSQADSHIKLIKSTIQATFPNFTAAALVSTQAALDLAATQSAGTSVSVIPLGTVTAPGLSFIGNSNCGMWSPAGNQIAFSLGGTQVLLMGGTSLITSLGIGAAAIASTGAYSGGTGQLVPIGAVLEWYDDVLPTEGGYCWANGQIIASANTVCPVLLARWAGRFGGNGVTTMGVPDRRATAGVGRPTMGGVATRGIVVDQNLNTLFGAASATLAIGNLPPISSTANINISVSAKGGGTGIPVTTTAANISDGIANGVSGTFHSPASSAANWHGVDTLSDINTITVTASGTASTPVPTITPSTMCNYILRLG